MKNILCICLLGLLTITVKAQSVGVGTTSPHTSAALDISSTSKGLLIPRMTTVQRDAIATPLSGLQILNLDDYCVDIYNGTSWIKNCGMKVTGTDTIENGAWEKKADFGGTTRRSAVSFSIAPFCYVGTGVSGSTYKKDFWQFDPATNIWTQKADFGGTARGGAVGVALNGYGYVGTGIDGSFKSDWWEYLPATNTWTQKAGFSGSARAEAIAFVLGTNIYVGTGENGSTYFDDFKVFNPGSNSWISGPSFPYKAKDLVVFNAGGFSFAGVGFHYDSFWGNYLDNAVYKFDGSAWTSSAIFPGEERLGAIAFGINGKGYVGLGKPYTANYFTDLWEYDPATNAWGQQSSCPVGRAYATAFTINNKGYVCTGYNGADLQDLYAFDPAPIGNVYKMPEMPYPTYSFSDGMWSKKGPNVYSESEKLIGIGLNEPKNKLDILGSGTRTNSHPSGRPLYLSGVNNSNSNGVEFRRDDATQGLGFGYNSIYTAGNNINQELILETKGAGSLIFTTNNNYRATITGSGNMGIGTLAPHASAALEVSSTSKGVLIPRMTSAQRIAIATPQTGLLVFDITSNSFWFRGTSAWLELSDNLDSEVFRNGPDKLYMGLTDSVGIGTNNPGHKLEVKTASNQYGISHTDGGVQIATWVGTGGEIGTISNHAFSLYANNNVDQFRLLPNGNIGIGLPGNPLNRLDIVNGAARTGTHATGRPLYVTGTLSDASNGVEVRDADGTQGVGLGRNTVYAAGSWADQNIGLAGKGTLGCVLMTTNGTERVRVTGAGNVGIGTSTPHAQLQLATSVANRKLILYEVANNDHQYHGFGINGDGALRYQTANTLNDHIFYAATSSGASNELARIKGDGNLSITGSVIVESFIAPTLLNSFTNYGFGFSNAGYYKDKMGRVHLRGMVNNVNNPSGLVVFTLPAGYRPTASGILLFTTMSNAALARVDIMTNGNVVISIGTAGWTSLDGISFKAD